MNNKKVLERDIRECRDRMKEEAENKLQRKKVFFWGDSNARRVEENLRIGLDIKNTEYREENWSFESVEEKFNKGEIGDGLRKDFNESQVIILWKGLNDMRRRVMKREEKILMLERMENIEKRN